MAKRSFQYQPKSKEALKERANARGGDFDSWIKSQYKTYKVREGKNLIRILPPSWPKAKHYGYDIFVNYNIGADKQSYLSLSKMKNERDPLAEARNEAEREGDDELIKALRPTKRIIMWVIDRMDEDAGPQLWAAPFGLDKSIAGAAIDDDTGAMIYIDGTEDKDGNDVRFHREGSGLLTKYPGEKIKVLVQSPIHEDKAIENEWLDYIADNPVPECLQFYDYKHISGVYNGGGSRPETDEENEKPARRAPKNDDEEETPRRRVSTRIEPDEPEEEVEEERPARTRRARVEPEEEAEETPAPRSGSIRDRLQKARQAMSDKGKKREDPDEED